MKRRDFLRFVTVGVIGTVAAARFAGDFPVARGSYTLAVIRQRKLMARIRITREAIEASRHLAPGAMMRAAAREEYRAAIASFDRAVQV